MAVITICKKNNVELIIIDGRIKYNNILKHIKNILKELCFQFDNIEYINNINSFTENMFNLTYESKKYRNINERY